MLIANSVMSSCPQLYRVRFWKAYHGSQWIAIISMMVILSSTYADLGTAN